MLDPRTEKELMDGSQSATMLAVAGHRTRHIPVQVILGGLLVASFIAIALLSIVWTPYDPYAIAPADRLLPPGSPGHLFGTERLGKDVLTQLMVGAKNSLYISIVSTTVAIIIGVPFGLVAAGSGPRSKGHLSRLADVGIAFPSIVIALVMATAIGPGATTAIVAIVAGFVPVVARVVIGPAEQVLGLDHVEAAVAYGRSRRFILARHVLPNIAPLVIVLGSVMFAAAILIEASLAFIGVGVPPPEPSWGRLLKETQPILDAAPYLMFFPGMAIVLTVLGFNLLGDGLRILLDPQQDER